MQYSVSAVFLLDLLLKDRTTKKNILWATVDYLSYGKDYSADSEITVFTITGENGEIIKPRTAKEKPGRKKDAKIKRKYLRRHEFAMLKII